MEILDPIPLDLNAKAMGEQLMVERTGSWEAFQSALDTARGIIAPKAAYAVHYVEARADNGVVIDDVYLESRVLRKNLEDVGRVFVYVATIGPSLEERADKMSDLLEKYYLDIIGNMALIQTRDYLEGLLRSRFGLGGLSFMSPGSLKDWPIEAQRPLFSFLKGAEHSIGVRLTENCLMMPRKSVSGIYFPTERTFYNCQLCPKNRCGGRQAAYDKDLARRYGI